MHWQQYSYRGSIRTGCGDRWLRRNERWSTPSHESLLQDRLPTGSAGGVGAVDDLAGYDAAVDAEPGQRLIPESNVPPTDLPLTTARALRQLQAESLESLHERLVEMGWEPGDVVVDAATGCAHALASGQRWLLFSQAAADAVVRERFAACRAMLPDGLKVHGLPLPRVGALATVTLDALAGYADDESEDFIAVSVGLLKLRPWALTVAHAMGVDTAGPTRNTTQADGGPPQAWWRASLLAAAYDVLGCTADPVRMATIAAWDARRQAPASEAGMAAALERFVILHEIGHYELGHGGICRAQGRSDRPARESCHFMEAEADGFALDHLRALCSSEAAPASTVCLVFLLFALSPDLVGQYPFCDDTDAYPHPLTRLIWLLRRLFPGDAAAQAAYVRLVIRMLSAATEGSSFDLEGMEDTLAITVMSERDAPGPPGTTHSEKG